MPKKKTIKELDELPINIDGIHGAIPAELVKEETNLAETEDEESKSISLGRVDPNAAHRKVKAQCNSCFVSETCPKFQAGAYCSMDFKKLFEDEYKMERLPMGYLDVVDMQFERVQRAYKFEIENQGVLDPNLTKEIELFSKLIQDAKRLTEKNSTFTISATGEAAGSGGILSKLLTGK
jgi:hypothetical protein